MSRPRAAFGQSRMTQSGHGVDVDGAVVIRKRISQAKLLEFFAILPACLKSSSRA